MGDILPSSTKTIMAEEAYDLAPSSHTTQGPHPLFHRRLRGKGFAGRDQLRGEVIKGRGHVPSNAAPLSIVLMAEQEVHRVHLLVDKITDRIAELDTPTILLDLLLLLSKPPKCQSQASQTPVRGIEFRPCARS